MKVMLIVAVVLSVVLLIVAFFMPNWHLGDIQNAVDHEQLDGEKSPEDQKA